MCGIVGIFAFESSIERVSRELIVRMRDAMAHRGPDGAGVWISGDQKLGLGHRRLSIVDLSAAADQPMSTADGRLRIVFNGEIYNHAEIRAELDQVAPQGWQTDHSDTEVILRAFEQWGIDCLHRLRGMFVFALWDQNERKLWLVRDRIGIKPLYFAQTGGRIAFASEIKALLMDPRQKRAVNEEMLFHYLSFLTTPSPGTLFAGIAKLPPGTYLEVNCTGKVRQHKYWDPLDHHQSLEGRSEADIAEGLLAELRTAVKYRKVSDVPVGVFLSGGIDSSTNAALFSEDEPEPVKTFSIGYEGEHQTYQNELHHARRMADFVGSDHHERILSQDDLLNFLPHMIELQDEPIADPVCVPVYYVSELARQHGVVVCHVGEGSDELFWGYPSWKRSLRLQQLDDLPFPRWSKKLGLAALQVAGKGDSKAYEWLRRGAEGLPIFWSGAEAFSQAHKQTVLSERLTRQFSGLSSWDVIKPYYDDFRSKAFEKSTLNWMSYADLRLRLPELLLMRVDKMSMGVSLEARVPFLDHRFVEYAMSIPTEIKTRNGELKSILKLAVRGVIPDDIIGRPKQGFGVPIYEWFLDRLGQFARLELKAFCRETDFFDESSVDALFDNRQGEHAWFLLNFALWWRTFIAGERDTASEFHERYGARI